MTYSVSAVFRFLGADGNDAKPSITYAWSGLNDVQVIDGLEAALITWLGKTNATSSAANASGAAKSMLDPNPLMMTFNTIVDQDNKPWAKAFFTWYNMGDVSQALLTSLFEAELAAVAAKHPALKK